MLQIYTKSLKQWQDKRCLTKLNKPQFLISCVMI